MSPTARSFVDPVAKFHQRHPDEWLNALADERRLLLVETLRSADTPIEKEDVARHIAAEETGRPLEGLDPETVRGVLVSLHHHHLPRLADLGVIEYRERTGTIEELRIHEDVQLLDA